MEKAPAKMMREFVRSQNFTSTEDIIIKLYLLIKKVKQPTVS